MVCNNNNFIMFCTTNLRLSADSKDKVLLTYDTTFGIDDEQETKVHIKLDYLQLYRRQTNNKTNRHQLHQHYTMRDKMCG